MSDSSDLHLPDLTIKGFRGIEELTIPRLGRVTLLVGKNSVGKTTVLDAVQAYAARGRQPVLEAILSAHEETVPAIDEDGNGVSGPDWSALFYGRHLSPSHEAVVGPQDTLEQMTIRVAPLPDEQLFGVSAAFSEALGQNFVGDDPHGLWIEYGGHDALIGLTPADERAPTTRIHSWHIRRRTLGSRAKHPLVDAVLSPVIICERIGPDRPNNAEMTRLFDRIALTESQESVVEALRLIFGEQVDALTMVANGAGSYSSARRPIVKLEGHEQPVPLRSLGDGALRLFGVALTLANCKGGLLLMDEAENGIHYSLQRKFWRMVLQTADRNDVQVIATTHGWDCIAGFALAATELEHIDGVLFRLSDTHGQLRAVEYTEEEMVTAAEQGIEMR